MDNKSKFYMGGLLAGLLSLPGALWADCTIDIKINPLTNAISAYSLSGQGNFSCRDLGMEIEFVSVVTMDGNTLDWEIGNKQVDAVAVEDSSGKRCVYNYAPGAIGGVGLAPPSNKDISNYLICSDGVPSPVPNAAPTVMITSPSITDSPFPGGSEIFFEGDAHDSEDGDLTDDLQWNSSLDGPLGSGGRVPVSDLSAGVHLITAQVTDSGDDDGSGRLTGSDLISIEVLATVAQNCVVSDDETSVLINGVAVTCPVPAEGDDKPRLVCSADLSDGADKFELDSTACCLCNATAVECDANLAEGNETGDLIACPDSGGTKGALQVPSTLMFNNDPYYCYTIGGKRTCFAY